MYGNLWIFVVNGIKHHAHVWALVLHWTLLSVECAKSCPSIGEGFRVK